MTKVSSPELIMNQPPAPKTVTYTPFLVKHKFLVGILLVLALAGGYVWARYRYFVVVATVNNKPIHSWTYLKQINQAAGKQIVEQMVIEQLIKQQAVKQNITISQEEYDQRVAEIDKQFAQLGGLESFLAAQNISKQDFETQVRLNLLTEKLAGKPEVSDDEVNTYYQDNQSTYADISVEEAKTQIRSLLERQKTSDEIQKLLADYQKTAEIRFYLPGVSN